MSNTIHHQISLKNYNTFGVEVSCKNFINIRDESQLITLFNDGAFLEEFFVLGAGSNVLFTRDFEGLIVRMDTKGIAFSIEDDFNYVTASAGEIWNDLVWFCVDHNFGGVENLALIPGTVGASPVQNIGAYGTELMDVFHSCRAFDTTTGQFTNFQRADCKFTYRDSIFKSTYKGRFVITSVTFKLQKHHKINTTYGAINMELAKRGISSPTIREIAEVVSAIRVEKLPDPSTIGNAGSFFKNPLVSSEVFKSLQAKYPTIVSYFVDENYVKLAAGWLIESCGWKGKVDGNVAIWKNQALVITNLGSASGADIYTTSSKIVNDVYKKFGITLEREVNIL